MLKNKQPLIDLGELNQKLRIQSENNVDFNKKRKNHYKNEFRKNLNINDDEEEESK